MGKGKARESTSGTPPQDAAGGGVLSFGARGGQDAPEARQGEPDAAGVAVAPSGGASRQGRAGGATAAEARQAFRRRVRDPLERFDLGVAYVWSRSQTFHGQQVRAGQEVDRTLVSGKKLRALWSCSLVQRATPRRARLGAMA